MHIHLWLLGSILQDASYLGRRPPGLDKLCVSIRAPILLFKLIASNPSAAQKTRSSEQTLDEHSSI